MKKIPVILLFLGLPFMVFSQEIAPEEFRPQSAGLLQAAIELPAEGTYQIVIQGTTEELLVPDEFLLQVNQQRKLDIDITIPVSEHVSLLVFSIQKIRDENFVPGEKYRFIP